MERRELFHRSELLLGEECMQRLREKRVIVFGVGGVGSWCAESLVRTGLEHITIVDSDTVMASNINRQLPADVTTIGRAKVEVLKEHFLHINPEVQVNARQERYTSESSASFRLNEYDYVIDAIDSVPDKMHLIRTACLSDAVLFSSMGAALKMDPTRIQVAEFWKVKGDALARALRQRFRKEGKPARKFQCVFSEERLQNTSENEANGSLMQVTAAFGLTLASLILRELKNEG